MLALRWSDIEDDAVLITRSLSQTRAGLAFKETKNRKTRPCTPTRISDCRVKIHRATQDAYRQQFRTAYNSNLDLIFAEPNGTPLRPDSISSSVSALFNRLKIPNQRAQPCTSFGIRTGLTCWLSGMELPAGVGAARAQLSARDGNSVFAPRSAGETRKRLGSGTNSSAHTTSRNRSNEKLCDRL